MTKNYKMLVEIPITNVPDNISNLEVQVNAEVWLKQKIEDASIVKFSLDGRVALDDEE